MPRLPPPHAPRADDPYLQRWIAEHGEDAWRDLGSLAEREPERARVILRDLVACACTAASMPLVNLGRWGVLAMPHAWVVANVRAAVDEVIADGDDAGYRRALELVSFVDRAMLAELVALGERSPDADVREAAADWCED